MKKPYKRKSLVIGNVFYFAFAMLNSLILIACYCLIKRIDSIVFSAFIALVNALSLIVMTTKQNMKSNNKYILATTNETNISLVKPMRFNDSSGSYVKCFKIFLKVMNGFFKLVFLVLIGLLAASAAVMSYGAVK